MSTLDHQTGQFTPPPQTSPPTHIRAPVVWNSYSDLDDRSLPLRIFGSCDSDSLATHHVAASLVEDAFAWNISAFYAYALRLMPNGGIDVHLLLASINDEAPWDILEERTRFKITTTSCCEYRVAFTSTWYCVYTLPAHSSNEMCFVFVCPGVYFFAATIRDDYIILACQEGRYVTKHPPRFALEHGSIHKRVVALVKAYDSFVLHRNTKMTQAPYVPTFCQQCYTACVNHEQGAHVIEPIQVCKTCEMYITDAIGVHLVPDLAHMVWHYLDV
jgi:hypothetical protein